MAVPQNCQFALSHAGVVGRLAASELQVSEQPEKARTHLHVAYSALSATTGSTLVAR